MCWYICEYYCCINVPMAVEFFVICKWGWVADLFATFVPSVFLSHICLLSSFSVLCVVFFLANLSLFPNPLFMLPYLHPPPYFSVDDLTRPGLTISSATSSSLQPLMMRKPLLRHWSRVCRQSMGMKHSLSKDPTARLILNLYRDSFFILFYFFMLLFPLYVTFNGFVWSRCFTLKWFAPQWHCHSA